MPWLPRPPAHLRRDTRGPALPPPAQTSVIFWFRCCRHFSLEQTLAGARPCCAPAIAASTLIRPLRLVHVHILGVDHIARLLLLRAARARRRTPASSSARRASLPCRTRRLGRLVQLLGDLVQRTLDVFRRRPQPRHAAFVDGLLRVFDGLFGLFHIRFGDLLAVFAEHLLRLVEDAVQAVARLDLFHSAPVLFTVCFGLRLHLLGLFFGQAARRGDGDLLLLIRGLVLRAHVQDAVGVDVKRDLDLRRPARSRRNPVQFEFAKRTVVIGELAFPLHDLDFHARLVVRRRRIGFHLARRDRSVARDLHGHHAPERFDAQRKRRHVQQQDVLYTSGTDS